MGRNGRKQKVPAFQFYPGDFLASDAVALMSNAEVGVYIKLLCRAWQGDGLPVQLERLARLVGEDAETFRAMWDGPLGEQFEECEGRLVNERMEAERAVADEYREECARNGAKGAEARWGRKNAPDGPENGPAIARPSPGHSQAIAKATQGPMANDGSHPIPSHPIPSLPTTPESARAEDAGRPTVGEPALEHALAGAPLLPDEAAQAARDFAVHESEAGRPRSRSTWVKRVRAAAADPAAFVATVEHSIANGWTKLVPPEEPRKRAGPRLTRYQEAQQDREAWLRAIRDGEAEIPDGPAQLPGGAA